jgi:hypothetical protein
MCEECDESPPLFIAYFNKPGGKLWRPSRAGGATPIVHSLQPVPAAIRAFACDAVPPAPAAGESQGEGTAVVPLSPAKADGDREASLLPLPARGDRVAGEGRGGEAAAMHGDAAECGDPASGSASAPAGE